MDTIADRQWRFVANLLREDDVMERCTYNSLSWWEGKGEEGRG